MDPKVRFPSSRPFFLLSSLLPYTLWRGSSPPPLPTPQVAFLSLCQSRQAALLTFRVFQAVGQPTTLPGPCFCIEHCVEPQLAQFKRGPLQQGDLVLDGQVPGSKDASGGQLPGKPPQASTPPLIQKSGEGEEEGKERGRMRYYCEDCCSCFRLPPISPPPNPVKHITSPCHLPLVSFYLQGLPCQWSLSSRSLTAWPHLL